MQKNLIPSGQLSDDYLKYTLWKAVQRLASSTCSVFGTQALVLALGFKRNKIGLAAATTWVIKDALGKMTRVLWATRYGRKFDTDAKKWRFRSALIFSLGNALEILTYVVPGLFLIIAAAANALKQMSMVTASATRNSIYKSFARYSDNIGDITAKGEAQMAIIDLLGIALGVSISKAIGVNRPKIIMVFLLLSFIDILCIFQEIKSVVFRVLNWERSGIVLHSLFPWLDVNSSSNTSGAKQIENYKTVDDIKSYSRKELLKAISPTAVAEKEKLFYPTRQGENMMKTFSKLMWNGNVAGTDSSEHMTTLTKHIEKLGSGQKFIIILRSRIMRSYLEGVIIKCRLKPINNLRMVKGYPVILSPQILLHVDAKPIDVFQALIAVHRIIYEFCLMSESVTAWKAGQALKNYRNQFKLSSSKDEKDVEVLEKLHLDSENLLLQSIKASEYAKANNSLIYDLLVDAEWDMSRFTFGTLSKRVKWPLEENYNSF